MRDLTIQPKPTTTVNGDCAQYLPIKVFFEQMQHSKEVNPYSSTFSFLPFIEKMKARTTDIQEVVNNTAGDFITEAIKDTGFFFGISTNKYI